jgi:hypothetical protein
MVTSRSAKLGLSAAHLEHEGKVSQAQRDPNERHGRHTSKNLYNIIITSCIMMRAM